MTTYRFEIDYSTDAYQESHVVTVYNHDNHLIGSVSVFNYRDTGDALRNALETRALHKLRHRIARGYSVDCDNYINNDVVQWLASNYD